MKSEHKAYIESGVIEDYCLGIAAPSDISKLLEICHMYPESQIKLDNYINYFDFFVQSFSRKPSIESFNIISDAISNSIKLQNAKLLGEDLMMSEFVGISRHSNVEHWENLVACIEPPIEYDNIFAKPLFFSDTHELTLVWSKELIPDEVHLDLHESFLILEGTVDCYVEDKIFSMVKGDFMQIPMNVHHRVVVTSEISGKAIMSRIVSQR